MKKIFITCVAILMCSSVNATSRNKPRLMAHYMPWYTTKQISGSWGWHWTMNHFDPEKLDKNGKREVASHYYPLIGTYDSNDSDVLEYHVLLMKLAGIDGVIIDWYGTETFWDYGINHQNTLHVIKYIKKAGMTFAICYEDRTLKHMTENNHIKKENAVQHSKTVMQWVQKSWFKDPAYERIKGQPLLLLFGPEYFKNGEWTDILAGLSPKPLFFAVDNKPPMAMGAFTWPPMGRSKNGVLSNSNLDDYLKYAASRAKKYKYSVGAAFPGFHDIYKEAGRHKSYGYLAANGTKTYEHTLLDAIKNKYEVIQLVTWNDYGEGTIIEPTKEFGYVYLETTQKIRKRKFDPFFRYTAQQLRIPHQLYQLRKKYKSNKTVSNQLDKASDLLFAGKIPEGGRMLVAISKNLKSKKQTSKRNK